MRRPNVGLFRGALRLPEIVTVRSLASLCRAREMGFHERLHEVHPSSVRLAPVGERGGSRATRWKEQY